MYRVHQLVILIKADVIVYAEENPAEYRNSSLARQTL